MSRKQNKQIRQEIHPKGRHIKEGADPAFYRTQNPLWKFNMRDKDHDRWGWKCLNVDQFFDQVYDKLFNFQTMTWAEIESQAGGRKQGTNSHELSIADDLCKEAQRRLEELKILEDSIFSLRLQGTHRIYGVRKGRILHVIWFDENHEICPTAG